MSLRLIEITVPQGDERIDHLLDDDVIVDRWQVAMGDDKVLLRLLVKTEQTESLLDQLSSRFDQTEGFRLMLLPVEATLPRPPEAEQVENGGKQKTSPERISREELFDDVAAGANLSRVFVMQTVLATLVAAVGLLRDDTAIIIGAMVIAPLLGPNVALCLATTLGDPELAVRSLKTNLAGIAVALASSLVIGFLFTIDPTIASIAGRTSVNGADIVLALASGCAGVLAFTTGAPASLIGVMVAVALLPPFAVFGLLLASGDWQLAGGALMLVATNVICVNLAGVLTFAVQGLRPRTWWQAERAKKATWIAVGVWAALLAVLLALIVWSTETLK